VKWAWEIATLASIGYGIFRLWRSFLGTGPRLTEVDVIVLGVGIVGIFRAAFKLRTRPFRNILLALACIFSFGLTWLAWSYANLWTTLECVVCGVEVLRPDFCSTMRTRRIASDFRPLHFAFVPSLLNDGKTPSDPCQSYVVPSSQSTSFTLDRAGPGPELAISWRVEPISRAWRVARQFVRPFDNGAGRAEPGVSREASPDMHTGLQFTRSSTRVDVIICGIPDQASEDLPRFDLYLNITDIKVVRLSR
jgi:hypothetical protein